MLDIPDDEESKIATGSGGTGFSGKIMSAVKSEAGSSSKKQSQPADTGNAASHYFSYKKGGKVPGRGPKKVIAHGGERILNAKQTRKYERKRGRK